MPDFGKKILIALIIITYLPITYIRHTSIHIIIIIIYYHVGKVIMVIIINIIKTIIGYLLNKI